METLKGIRTRDGVVSVGDMTQAVYDPQGKNKDIFAEMNNYLPLTGGTLTGFLAVNGGNTKVDNGSLAKFTDNDRKGNGVSISLNPNNKLARQALIQKFVNGSYVSPSFAIFGEHNKPKGTYTGNGNAEARTITVIDGGDAGYGLLHLSSGSGEALVGSFCTVSWTGTTVRAHGKSEVKYYNGILTVSSDSSLFNGDGASYFYKVLY